MATKTVYQLDENGYYIGDTLADESPMEPGVFLMPSGCVEEAPPPAVEGKLRRYLDGAWVYEDIPAAPQDPEPAPPTLDEIKARLISSVDDRIAAIYARFQRFQPEYVEREKAAKAYKDAGYAGTYSPWIDSFANSAGMSISVATDLILTQAERLRVALANLGALRMKKYSINAAPTEDEAVAVRDQIVTDSNAIAAQL